MVYGEGDEEEKVDGEPDIRREAIGRRGKEGLGFL